MRREVDPQVPGAVAGAGADTPSGIAETDAWHRACAPFHIGTFGPRSPCDSLVSSSVMTLLLSRWQFGITTVFHFIFVPLTIPSLTGAPR